MACGGSNSGICTENDISISLAVPLADRPRRCSPDAQVKFVIRSSLCSCLCAVYDITHHSRAALAFAPVHSRDQYA